MASKADIIAAAEGYVGTPHAHQQSVRGVGIDCVNFISAVAKEAGAIEEAGFESNYRHRSDGVTMLEILERHMDLVSDIESAELADVVAFHDGRLKGEPRHLAIVNQLQPYVKIVHASERGVRIHRMDALMRSRVHSVWRLKHLDD